jgi:hypothetical protein
MIPSKYKIEQIEMEKADPAPRNMEYERIVGGIFNGKNESGLIKLFKRDREKGFLLALKSLGEIPNKKDDAPSRVLKLCRVYDKSQNNI